MPPQALISLPQALQWQVCCSAWTAPLVMMQASLLARTSPNASCAASFPESGDPTRGIFEQFL
jgi:hypothetical protein